MWLPPSALARCWVRAAYVQTAAAQGLQAAGSNPAGAGTAFMGMGAGMASMAGVFQNIQPAQQPAQQPVQNQAAGWQCGCGMSNQGNFCANCGAKRPVANGPWQCSCGMTNQGNFCSNCGNRRG